MCFCNFELSEITYMDGNKITGMYNGVSNYIAVDMSDSCFLVNSQIKIISERMQDFYHYFIEELEDPNYPNLHWKILKRWKEMCENSEDKIKLQKLMSNANIWFSQTIDSKKINMVTDSNKIIKKIRAIILY